MGTNSINCTDIHTIMSKDEIMVQLFLKYGKLMLKTAYDILNDYYLAQDAVQMSFLNLGKSNFRLDSISCNKTKSFMILIVRNYAFRIYNFNKKEALSYYDEEIEIPDDNNLPLDIVLSNESVTEVKDLLDTIDSKYSTIIMLKYLSDYSNSEIATMLDISEQLVRVRLFRGKKLLLEKLTEGVTHNE